MHDRTADSLAMAVVDALLERPCLPTAAPAVVKALSALVGGLAQRHWDMRAIVTRLAAQLAAEDFAAVVFAPRLPAAHSDSPP